MEGPRGGIFTHGCKSFALDNQTGSLRFHEHADSKRAHPRRQSLGGWLPTPHLGPRPRGVQIRPAAAEAVLSLNSRMGAAHEGTQAQTGIGSSSPQHARAPPAGARLAPAGSRPQRSLRLRPRHADLDRAPDLRRAPDPTRRGGLRLGRGEPLRLRRRLLRFRRVFRRAVRRLPRQYPKSRPFKKGGTRAGTSARWKRFIQAPNTR